MRVSVYQTIVNPQEAIISFMARGSRDWIEHIYKSFNLQISFEQGN